ncbi:stage 0 sporulation family protein [Spirochaetia bacterium 38H-sp]|uniref:Stage 0 sporulation family protein n=1 Tax=Rarispira pelagica TaxID=3141764 RepID=A0ABU9UEC9_9SPIR
MQHLKYKTCNDCAVSCDKKQRYKIETHFVLVKVLHTSETEICSVPQDLEIFSTDYVIVQSKYGRDLAIVLGPAKSERESLSEEKDTSVKELYRKATEEDIVKYNKNIEEEKKAFDLCLDKIKEHGLDMKLVSVHYLTDEPKILFFFTADGRVDFRALVKDLVSMFKKRIELRQIGVRDEARLVGGVGVCGRSLCCHSVTDHLVPVSIKMAKVQNISLNSMKISGPCGRLLCCLAYEYDIYEQERQEYPVENTRVEYDGMFFKVTEVNILSQKIYLSGPDGQFLVVGRENIVYSNDRWMIKPDVEL